MKKIFLLSSIFAIFVTVSASAQQITKFAVVDTAKVYQAYFRDSTPVRNYENKKADFQKELDKLVAELQRLNDKKVEQKRKGNNSEVLKIEAEITKKTDYINEYTKSKNIELESLKKSLKENNKFYQELYSTLEQVAEEGGYSMVLSLQDANAVLWYSSSVDITEQVISKLGLK